MRKAILWIDESELQFAQNDKNDNAYKVLNYLIKTLIDLENKIFIVMTSSSTSYENLKKVINNNFWDLCFVDLPNFETRKEIFKIAIGSNKQISPFIKEINIDLLALKTEDFTRDDILKTVNRTLEKSFLNSKDYPTTQDYLEKIISQIPFTKMFPKKFDEYKKLKEEIVLKLAD